MLNFLIRSFPLVCFLLCLGKREEGGSRENYLLASFTLFLPEIAQVREKVKSKLRNDRWMQLFEVGTSASVYKTFERRSTSAQSRQDFVGRTGVLGLGSVSPTSSH